MIDVETECSQNLLNSYKILSKDSLRVIEQIYIIHEANSLSALHLSRKLDKLQKLISDHFCRIDSLRHEINTTPGVYFPPVLSESCRIFRRYTRLRFQPVRQVVVIDRIDIRSDVKTDAVLVERSFLHKGLDRKSTRLNSSH